MQGVREATRSETGRSPGPHVSPGKAFVILGVVLVAAGVALLITRPDSAPPSTGIPESKNFALTDAEAINRFKELDELRQSAYRTQDASLIQSITSSNSGLRELGISEIEQLQQDDIISRTEFQTRRLRVLRNSPLEIVVRQVVVITPAFINKKGADVTESPRLLQTVDWVLHPEGSRWLLHSSEIVSSQELKH